MTPSQAVADVHLSPTVGCTIFSKKLQIFADHRLNVSLGAKEQLYEVSEFSRQNCGSAAIFTITIGSNGENTAKTAVLCFFLIFIFPLKLKHVL